MAKKNYEKELLDAYNRAKEQVGRDLDKKYVSRIVLEPKYMANGFGAAYEQVTGIKYGTGINTSRNWEEVLKQVNFNIISKSQSPKATNNKVDLNDAFLGSVTQGLVRDKANRMRNTHVVKGSQSSKLIIMLQSQTSGSPQRESFAKRYREIAWEEWKITHNDTTDIGTAKLGVQTPYEHMDPSTAGGDALQFFKNELEHNTNQGLAQAGEIVRGYLSDNMKATIESIETLIMGALEGQSEWQEELVYDDRTGNFEMQRVVTARIGSLATNSKIAQKTDPDNVRLALKNIVEQQFKKIAPLDPSKAADFESSKSLKDKAKIATKLIVANKFKRSRNLKIEIKDATELKSESRGSKVKGRKKAHKIINANIRGESTRVKKQNGKSQSLPQQALQLKTLINAALPEELLKQMGSPRLNNRTGRFRQSARVTDVRIGNRGGTEIDYTYQLNPYQTFEPGGAMGSTNRDPRSLISLSIREIAQDLIGRKFIKTRRV